MERFVTICHHEYSNSNPPLIKGEEYFVRSNKGLYQIYKNDIWITTFMDQFVTYFYTKDQVDKIREQRLKNILE